MLNRTTSHGVPGGHAGPRYRTEGEAARSNLDQHPDESIEATTQSCTARVTTRSRYSQVRTARDIDARASAMAAGQVDRRSQCRQVFSASTVMASWLAARRHPAVAACVAASRDVLRHAAVVPTCVAIAPMARHGRARRMAMKRARGVSVSRRRVSVRRRRRCSGDKSCHSRSARDARGGRLQALTASPVRRSAG